MRRALVASILLSLCGVASAHGDVLPGSLPAGHGVALDVASVEAARALSRGTAALDAGDFTTAQAELARASAAGILPDYVALELARLEQKRGEYAAAAARAGRAREAHPQSPVVPELAFVEGEALAAQGDEARARAAWQAALEPTTDLDRRREIKLAIVHSRKRSGEIEAGADDEQLLASLFTDGALPGELPPGQRSAKAALEAGDALLAQGRGEQAIAAYREALAGELDAAARRHAEIWTGRALFALRRYDEAVVAFSAHLDDPDVRLWRARSYARSGHVERAIREFDTLVVSAPPEVASRAAYLVATLYQDRGDSNRAMERFATAASFTRFPDRAAEALWRIGWSAYRHADYAVARSRLVEMAALALHETDPLAGLRPRYWAARAAEKLGQEDVARAEFRTLATGYPLAYYGWRAQERLGAASVLRAPRSAGIEYAPRTVSEAALQRVALLIEAGLANGAQIELGSLADRARTLADHVVVGRLLAAAGDFHRAQRLVVDAYALPLAQGLEAGREWLWWLSWPPAYRDLVSQALPEDAPIEPALVWAIMREESGFRPAVMSSAGAMGLLQLMPETAQRMATSTGRGPLADGALFEPETNIALGSAYLVHLTGRFPGRLSAAIGSYNAGPNAVERWLAGEGGQLDDDVWVEDIPYDQTQRYVKRVLRSLHAYRTFYPAPTGG